MTESNCEDLHGGPRGESWGIVGYRYFTDRKRFEIELQRLVAAYGRPARVVSGGADGADTLAREWGLAQQLKIIEHLPATLDSAGYRARNSLIVRDSDLIVAFLAPQSRGTRDTIRKAKIAGKRVIEIHVD